MTSNVEFEEKDIHEFAEAINRTMGNKLPTITVFDITGEPFIGIRGSKLAQHIKKYTNVSSKAGISKKCNGLIHFGLLETVATQVLDRDWNSFFADEEDIYKFNLNKSTFNYVCMYRLCFCCLTTDAHAYTIHIPYK